MSDTDHLFDVICNAFRVSSLESLVHVCKETLSQDYIVPGWNGYDRETHTEARHCCIFYGVIWENLWDGPVCELMRKTRLSFKHLLKQCQQCEDMVRPDAWLNQCMLKI